MTWVEELRKIATRANGDWGLYCALVALRMVENGRPGREFGVVSIPAPTYDDQLRVAINSLKHALVRAIDKMVIVKDEYGFYTDEFLDEFSSKWAPIGADNDPNGLNANHARNLKRLNKDYTGRLLACLVSMDA